MRRSILSDRAKAFGSSLRQARESKDKMWYVYILECKNGDLYTGITNNLQRRFGEHTSGKGGHFTKSFGAKDILFSEEHPDKSSALKREAQIKSWPRKNKLALIKGDLELSKRLSRSCYF